ncbi:reverse transcriptase domain-containing protein [Tanacetum coccineum]
MQLPPKKENQDRYCDYHGEKGHYTNDCFQLRKQLEIALESGRLNHLIKDVRQRGRGNTKGRETRKDKVINILEAVMEGYLVRRVYVDQGALVQGVATLTTRPAIISECRMIERKQMVEQEASKNDGQENEVRERLDRTEETLVNPAYPDQLVAIGGNLSEQCKNRLRTLLKNSMDVFAWEPADMTGVPRRIIEHVLNVNPSIEPVAQKRKVMAADRTQIVSKEVEEWVSAGIVRPVRYPTWISNPVLVKKSDGTWRMCIDFKNANSACPKDYYPLPDIGGKIKAVVGFRYKCFLDAYKGYHQIQMASDDEEKTAFYTDQGTYCYTKMPFGLKNTGATYQRLVDTAFQSHIGRNLEAYVDDMVIKSNDKKILIEDIAETFDNLRRINMKLNLKKYSFGFEEGKFLGYMVTSERIRANPKKTKAIADMQSPQTLKEMQSLSGKLVALKRFLSRSAKKSLPFFETLIDITKENKDEYRWTKNAEKAFQEMKKVIVELSLLTTPVKEETLYVYVAAATEALSGTTPPLEKLALSLLHTSRILRRYFEAHPIKVITDQPLKLILNKAQASGKLTKYSVELGAYNITYEPRSAMKGQVLADFLSEAPVGTPAEEFYRLPAKPPNKDEVEKWTLFTDGASNSKGSGAGLVLISPSGVEFTYALRLNFASTNNEAKYEALLAGLRMAKKMKVRNIDVKVDSKLVENQINRGYAASNTSMIKYLATAKKCITEFETFAIQNIPRNSNQKADILSKLATIAFDHLTKKVLVEVLAERSTEQKEVGAIVEEEEDNWMTPIVHCLVDGVWSIDKSERRTLRMKINQYVLEEGACSGTEVSQNADDFNHVPMAVLPMGNGHPRPPTPSSWKNKIHHRSHRLLHEMDRSKTVGQDYRKGRQEVCMGEHRANGLVERANKSLMEGIKARLGREKAGWVDELPNVLWAHRTSLKQSNGETPFSLTYGSEVVIPAEIGMPTHRTMMIRGGENEDEMRLNMDLLQERREAAAIREEKYKTKMEQYYN